jgi:hypothetical protein
MEYGKAQWKTLSPKAMSAARQFVARFRARTQATRTSEIDMLTSSSVELVAFSSGRSSALDDLTENLTRGRISTLSSAGSWAEQDHIPVLITEL